MKKINFKIIVITLIVIFSVLLLVIIAQLFYPKNYSLPFSKNNGKKVGFNKIVDLKSELKTTLNNKKITFLIKNRQKDYKIADLGVKIDVRDLNQLSQYSTTQRLIPFSILFMRPEFKRAKISFDQQKLEKALQEIKN